MICWTPPTPLISWFSSELAKLIMIYTGVSACRLLWPGHSPGDRSGWYVHRQPAHNTHVNKGQPTTMSNTDLERDTH
jgi:hypothetical protein